MNNKLKKMLNLTFLISLMLLTACTEKNETMKENKDTIIKVEAPSVDIQTAVITNNIEAIKQHIKAGTNLNVKEPMGGSSPLISAAVFDKIEIAKLLIDAGADLNIQNNDGSTALTSAAFFCRTPIVELLLKSGADKTIKNNFNQTALESVSNDFSSVKPVYEMMGKMLGPMGVTVDLDYLEKTRPQIALMLK